MNNFSKLKQEEMLNINGGGWQEDLRARATLWGAYTIYKTTEGIGNDLNDLYRGARDAWKATRR
ncbi:hypothetical protein EXQ42_14745 [Clostridium botulinum]|nr:hypothetical protein [Clostridium botulinum]MBO0576015.1 hypothetical protein [Clostridium botulinum]